MKKLVTLKVTISNYRGEKTDRVIAREAESRAGAQEGTANGSVNLIPEEYYAPVKRAYNSLRGWIYANSMSFGQGVQAIPAESLAEFEAGFNEMAEAYKNAAKENIIDKRDEIEAINNSGRLGQLAERHHLPSDLSSKYDATFTLGSAEVDPILNGLEKEVADRIVADCEKEKNEAMQSCFDQLVERVLDMSGTLVDTMSAKDVKNKKFGGTLASVKKTIRIVRSLDFSGDNKLSDNLDKIEEVVAGLSNASLKASAEERRKVKSAAQAVIASLTGQEIPVEVEETVKDTSEGEIATPELNTAQESASETDDLDFDALGF